MQGKELLETQQSSLELERKPLISEFSLVTRTKLIFICQTPKLESKPKTITWYKLRIEDHQRTMRGSFLLFCRHKFASLNNHCKS